MIRFIHTSDWHLGKPFSRFSGDLPARLREARHGAIARIAGLARASGADLVLVAGDIFDQETPAPQVLAQALAALAQEADITWACLPGNHDPARPGGLWERIAADPPANLAALTEPVPTELRPGLWLLPAPLRQTAPATDPTAWMEAAPTPEGAHRIGIAHGPIASFGESGSAPIAPDRAARAGLGYLALGDWHSAQRIGPATWYCGTPEPDGFGRRAAGQVLSVALDGAEAPPQVAPLPAAQFAWVTAEQDLLPGLGPGDLTARLPETHARRDTLLSLRLGGRARLSDKAAWDAAAAHLAPELAHLVLDASAVESVVEAEDLDRIGTQGALRQAAEALQLEAADASLAPEARAAARDALDMLYSWSLEDEEAPERCA